MSIAERPIVDRLTDARRYAQMARQIAESTDALPDIRILAIRHYLMLVGEALDFVPNEIFAHEPLIPWRRVIALRHRLIHGYWLIDEDIINEIARNETEALVAALDRLIQKLR